MNSALEKKLTLVFIQDKRRGTISDSQLLALLYHEWDIPPSEARRSLDCFDVLNTIKPPPYPLLFPPTFVTITHMRASRTKRNQDFYLRRTRTHHNYHQW